MSEIGLQEDRIKKVLRGVAGGFAGRIATLIAPFLVMPALLTEFGERGFGIWATAVSLTTMAAFLDFGIGNAVLTGLSKALAINALRDARLVIMTGYIVLLTIAGVLVGLLLVGFALFAPVFVPSFTEQEISILWAILLAFFLSMPVSLVQRLLFAQQKVAQANAWMIAGSALSVSLCLLAVQGGLSAGLVTFLYASGTPAILLIATLAFFLRNPQLRPSLKDFELAIALDTLRSGLTFFVLSILTSVGLNIDQVLISAMFGAEHVVNYTVPYRLASVLMVVVNALYIPLWPANAEAIARHEWMWVLRNNLRMSLFGSALVAVSGLCLYLSSNWIIMFWMARDFSGQSEVVAASAILVVMMSLSSPYAMILNSMGKANIQSFAWLAFIITSIALKFQIENPKMLYLFPAINATAYAGIIIPIVITSSIKIVRGLQ